MMTKDEYFISLIRDPKNCVMSISEVREYHQKDAEAGEDEKADIMLWMSANLNKHVRTKAEFARARKFVTMYATTMLESNAYWMTEADENAAFDAMEACDADPRPDYDIAMEAFPELSFFASEGDI